MVQGLVLTAQVPTEREPTDSPVPERVNPPTIQARPTGETRQGRDKTNKSTHLCRGVGISQGGPIGGFLSHIF